MENELIIRINDEIWAKDDFDCESYYDVMCNKCKNLEYYFEKYNVTNSEMKIILAQKWGREDLAKIEFDKIELDDYQKDTITVYVQGEVVEEKKVVLDKYSTIEDALRFIELTNEAKKYVIENSYDPRYGARPIKRYIQR